MKELYEKASEFLWKTIGWRIKYFFKSIQNLIRWAPIIWKDRDWDHRYIYDILRFKIQNQAKYIGEKDRHTSAKRDAERMMTCVRLIERVSDEFYDGEYMDYQESEFHFEPCVDNPELSKLEIEEKWNNYKDFFLKYPRQYKRALAETNWYYNEKNDRTIAMWICNENQKRAQALLFKMLDCHIRGWWD
jgi:hypothetical protein